MSINDIYERLDVLKKFQRELCGRTNNDNEVLRGRLWIGCEYDAHSEYLSRKNINVVVSIGSKPSSYASITYKDITYLRLVCDDDPIADIAAHFDDALTFIHASIEQRGLRVLVHCQAGISRSATICMAYLMRYHHLSWAAAYMCVRVARPSVCPNFGFLIQLKEWETRSCK